MTAPDADDESLGVSLVRRASQVTRMLAWAGLGVLRLEAARVVLGERSLRASGSVVTASENTAEPYSASYALTTDETGVVRRLTVRVIRAQGEQHVTLSRSEEGIWLVDHGAGVMRTNFEGALDVDLAFSPLFNALPVRRLSLHRAAAEHDLPMVFVALPGLEVRLARQVYRTVQVGEPTMVSVTGVVGETFEANFTVDGDGLVLDYPGLAKRS